MKQVDLTWVTCLDTGHVEEVRLSVAETLETEGLIQLGAEGYIAPTQLGLYEALNDKQLMVCDFCSHPDVQWVFPAADHMLFRDKGVDHMSRAGWAACSICAHLIEQKLWDDLNDRAVKSFEIESPMVSALMQEAVKANTQRFEQNRTGPPVRVGGEDDE